MEPGPAKETSLSGLFTQVPSQWERRAFGFAADSADASALRGSWQRATVQAALGSGRYEAPACQRLENSSSL